MEDNILEQFVYHGHEERNLEYKGDIGWNTNPNKMKIIKTVMALSNIPDGGTIVIGVNKNGEEYIPNGLSDDNYDSFTQDDVSELSNEYADPYVELSVRRLIDNGKKFIVIQVKEFSEIPTICKKSGSEGLIRGGIYTRPRRKIETVIIPSQVEMREIINSAVIKGMVTQQKRNQLLGTDNISVDKAEKDKFDSQVEDLVL